MPPTQQHRFLAIETKLGTDKVLLKSFSINEQLGRLFQMEVELTSEDRAIKFEDVVGTSATVRLKMPDGRTRYFNGVVNRFVQEEQQQSYARYRATLVPWPWLLTRTADCRIFQNKKVPDIIEEVFKDHGFNDYKLKLSGSYKPWEYCVQYRETDFNFVSRLMEQEGIYYFFDHQDGKHTLVLADSAAAHETFEGYDTLVYRPPTTRQEENKETVTDWVIEKEVQPGMYVVSDFNPMTPKAPLLGNANVSRQHQGADYEIFDYPGEFEERAEGEDYAKLRIQELQTQHEILRAQATARGVAAGYKFTLKGHPRADQNHGYLITRASIHVNAGEYETGKGADDEFYSCSFAAIPASQQFRAPRLTPKPLIQGPQTAIVVGPKGEEIYTDEHARVKVHFHWDRHDKQDENSSCWIRVSQHWAGKEWGSIHIPRIGQEVIVEFLEGDPDRPIITGRVYNADQTPPYDLPSNKTQSGIKSHSTKGGGAPNFNELRFEDKKGDELVFLQGEKDLIIQIKNDASEEIGHDRNLLVKHDQIEQVQNDRTEDVKGAHTESIGKDRTLKISGKESKDVGDTLSLAVTGDVTEDFKAGHTEQTANAYTLKADTLVIEGQTKVTIKVGGSSITLDSSSIKIATSGTLDLESSAQLSAKSSAGTEVSSDAITTIKGSQVMIN
jgi:type VI secretion system secreted protein VgrG